MSICRQNGTKNISRGSVEVQKINKTLRKLHDFATQKNDYSLEEFIDFCVYPDMVKEWLNAGLGLRKIKKIVFDMFLRYEEQRKLFSV